MPDERGVLELRVLIRKTSADPEEVSKGLGWVPYNYRRIGEKVTKRGVFSTRGIASSLPSSTFWQVITWCYNDRIEASLDLLCQSLSQKPYVSKMLSDGATVDVILILEPGFLYEFKFGRKALELAVARGIGLSLGMYPRQATKFDPSQHPSLTDLLESGG